MKRACGASKRQIRFGDAWLHRWLCKHQQSHESYFSSGSRGGPQLCGAVSKFRGAKLRARVRMAEYEAVPRTGRKWMFSFERSKVKMVAKICRPSDLIKVAQPADT